MIMAIKRKCHQQGIKDNKMQEARPEKQENDKKK